MIRSVACYWVNGAFKSPHCEYHDEKERDSNCQTRNHAYILLPLICRYIQGLEFNLLSFNW